MMAKDGVNQGAALILTTTGRAREWGIDESRWIYLRGCCDLKERNILERPQLDASPAMALAYRAALDRAGVSADDVDAFDLYSCFPIAVFNACGALGISPNDPRRLTVTGGLAFFGGAGNNYSMHGIVNIAARLRNTPGGIGVVGANGGFLSKHSVGVYSRNLPPHGWVSHDDGDLQKMLDDVPAQEIAENPEGEAVVDAYSITCAKGRPVRTHIIAHLSETVARFLAATDPSDLETAQTTAETDMLGKTILVTSEGKGNRFALSADKLNALKQGGI